MNISNLSHLVGQKKFAGKSVLIKHYFALNTCLQTYVGLTLIKALILLSWANIRLHSASP